MLQFSREVAFATAHVYASFAENRGAWDARLEALVVDALVRGERSEELSGRAAALGWATSAPVVVWSGATPGRPWTTRTRPSAARPGRCGSEVLVGVHADQLVVVLGGATTWTRSPTGSADEFGDGPGGDRAGGRRAEPRRASRPPPRWPGCAPRRAWPEAPRPVAADDLLAERALDGDPLARAALDERVAGPLQAAGGEVLETVRAVLSSGGNLEASARAIFVHPNTVRYRLKRAAELTGFSATDPRGQLDPPGGPRPRASSERDRSLWH